MKKLFNIPPSVRKALFVLEYSGFEAFLAGGCVRDFLMSKPPHDFDIATNATPFNIVALFKDFRVIETGISHGTVTVVIENTSVEITTYRIDGEYKDCRHPDSVLFTSSLYEDLKRRDFTVNAMAYSERTGLVDIFSGQKHLKEKLIAAVGDGNERFKEDALRILRAVRFSSVLDFTIEKDTSLAMKSNKNFLKNISRERIFSELIKTLLGKNPSVLLSFLDILEVIIPEFSTADDNYIETGIKAVSLCPRNKFIRLSAFLYGLNDCTQAMKVLRDLKADNRTRNTAADLLHYSDSEIKNDKYFLTGLCSELGFEKAKMLIKLKKALILSAKKPAEKEPLKLDNAYETICRLQKDNVCISLKTLSVNGKDLINAGITDGKEIGKTLKKLLEAVIDGKAENNRDALLSAIPSLMD